MKKIKSIHILGLIALFIVAISVSSCTSNRKCNGKRGIKTNMGLM